MAQHTTHDISWSAYWKGVATILILLVAYIIREALIALFFSLILSSAIEPAVAALQRRGVPRILSVILLYLLIITTLGVLLYATAPSIASELSALLSQIDQLGPELSVYFSPEAINELRASLLEYANAVLSSGGSIFGFLSSILGGLAILIATAVISFYILINERGVPAFIRTLAPAIHEDYLIRLWLRVKYKLGRWLQAQIFLSLIIGILSYAAFSVLGLPYAIILALVAGMFEIVPIAGPIFAGGLALVVALTQSPELAFATLFAVVIIQQFENHILVPLVTKKLVGVNPVIVILSLMAGWQIGGVVGMILAIPVIVVFQEFIEDWASRKTAPAATP